MRRLLAGAVLGLVLTAAPMVPAQAEDYDWPNCPTSSMTNEDTCIPDFYTQVEVQFRCWSKRKVSRYYREDGKKIFAEVILWKEFKHNRCHRKGYTRGSFLKPRSELF